MHIAHFISLSLGLLYFAKYDGETGRIDEFKIFMFDENLILKECKITNDYIRIMWEEAFHIFQKIILTKIL